MNNKFKQYPKIDNTTLGIVNFTRYIISPTQFVLCWYFRDQKNSRRIRTEQWYHQTTETDDGKPHRINGPSIVRYDINGNIVGEEWWVDGYQMADKQEYFRELVERGYINKDSTDALAAII